MFNLFAKKIISGVLSSVLLVSSAGAVFTSTDNSKLNNNEYDGYIVKLNKEANVSLYSADEQFNDGSDNYIVVDSREEAEKIPDEMVEYIEPNYKVELFVNEDPSIPDTPNDPKYGSQWDMEKLGTYTAYKQGLTGKGVKVGFIDSGLTSNHEDLNPKLLHEYNVIDDSSNVKDTYGHGTFTSGVVAAQTNNEKGIIGIAPDSEIYMYKAFKGKDGNISDMCKGIYKAIEDGCQVLNMSFGLVENSRTLSDAVKSAADKGIILVAAVGNSGSNTYQFPASYDKVIGVGSLEKNDVQASFSQRNDKVDFVAPGVELTGLWYDNTLYKSDGKGTSFSAPMVTGMAALALGYCPEIDFNLLESFLKATSKDLGPIGRDARYGDGAVNIRAFVDLLKKEYKINYNLDGGTLEEGAPKTFEMGTGVPKLPIPTKTHFDFYGWYLDSSFTGNPVTDIAKLTMEDVTLYAKWGPQKTYTLRFNANGGKLNTLDRVIECGKPYGELPVPTRIGYKFMGWFTDRVNGEEVTSSTVEDERYKRTIYAHWEKRDESQNLCADMLPDNKIVINVNDNVLNGSVTILAASYSPSGKMDDLKCFDVTDISKGFQKIVTNLDLSENGYIQLFVIDSQTKEPEIVKFNSKDI